MLEVDDITDGSCKRYGLGPRKGVEVLYIAESDDIDAFAVLRDVAVFCGVEDTVINVVAERLECLTDDLDRAPVIVRQKVLDVLEECGSWLLGIEDAGKLEEETASPLLIMAALPEAGNREGLAGKPADKDIHIGKFFSFYGMDVAAVGIMRKIEVVGLDGIWVEFVGVDNLAGFGHREAKVNPANAGEEGCDREVWCWMHVRFLLSIC